MEMFRSIFKKLFVWFLVVLMFSIMSFGMAFAQQPTGSIDIVKVYNTANVGINDTVIDISSIGSDSFSYDSSYFEDFSRASISDLGNGVFQVDIKANITIKYTNTTAGASNVTIEFSPIGADLSKVNVTFENITCVYLTNPSCEISYSDPNITLKCWEFDDSISSDSCNITLVYHYNITISNLQTVQKTDLVLLKKRIGIQKC